jgi:hypothetical protein
MKIPLRVTSLFAFAAILAACGANIADPAIVTGPRILAVRAEPPEVAPGGTVRLDALVVDTAGSTTSYTWSLCILDPVLGAGSCTDPAHLTPLSTGKTAVLTVPANALDAIPAAQRATGISLFVALHVQTAGGTGLVRPDAIRSVRVSENLTPNVNPSLEWVTIAGSERPFPLLPDSYVTIETKASIGSVQTYVDIPTGVTVKEVLRVHWFVSDGDIGDSTTEPDHATGLESTVWHHTSTDPPQVWVVLYDGRGGIDWRVP